MEKGIKIDRQYSYVIVYIFDFFLILRFSSVRDSASEEQVFADVETIGNVAGERLLLKGKKIE
jgi:hypothetical protein